MGQGSDFLSPTRRGFLATTGGALAGAVAGSTPLAAAAVRAVAAREGFLRREVGQDGDDPFHVLAEPHVVVPLVIRRERLDAVSDRVVGAITTSDSRIAAAIWRGGSVPSVALSSISASTASAPRLLAPSRRRTPISRVPGSTMTSTSSPAFTCRQRFSTVSTAGPRSGTGADLM